MVPKQCTGLQTICNKHGLCCSEVVLCIITRGVAEHHMILMLSFTPWIFNVSMYSLSQSHALSILLHNNSLHKKSYVKTAIQMKLQNAEERGCQRSKKKRWHNYFVTEQKKNLCMHIFSYQMIKWIRNYIKLMSIFNILYDLKRCNKVTCSKATWISGFT